MGNKLISLSKNEELGDIPTHFMKSVVVCHQKKD